MRVLAGACGNGGDLTSAVVGECDRRVVGADFYRNGPARRDGPKALVALPLMGPRLARCLQDSLICAATAPVEPSAEEPVREATAPLDERSLRSVRRRRLMSSRSPGDSRYQPTPWLGARLQAKGSRPSGSSKRGRPEKPWLSRTTHRAAPSPPTAATLRVRHPPTASIRPARRAPLQAPRLPHQANTHTHYRPSSPRRMHLQQSAKPAVSACSASAAMGREGSTVRSS